tara:strand:+ start:326 stop:601 length:276 start_codon:yes stop_codon:yes gene_type:complete
MMAKHEPIFVGTHDRLVTGEGYTIYAYALLTGVSASTLYHRIKDKQKVTDFDVMLPAKRSPTRAPNSKAMDIKRLETDADRLSAKWLKVTL